MIFFVGNSGAEKGERKNQFFFSFFRPAFSSFDLDSFLSFSL